MNSELKLMVGDGDWVMTGNEEDYVKVHSVHKGFVYIYNHDNTIGCYGLLELIKPIVLKPEILEKIGLEYIHGQVETYKHGKFYFYFDGKCLSANFGHVEQNDLEIEFVHQFQQLIRLFTQKEIEIKWEGL